MNSQLNLERALVIREARTSDSGALERLAALDSARVPAGRVLVAEAGDDMLAAVPIRGGRPVADPFRPTAAVVDLLQMRAAQVR